MLLLAEKDLPDYFAALGPEPFRINLARFARLFAGRTAPVKNLLLNQNRLRGLGNIYSSEALFVAGVPPARPAGALGAAELKRLFRALRRVLREAIAGPGPDDFDQRPGQRPPGGDQ